MRVLRALRAKLWKYFSGKLILVQAGAGLGAVAGRSAAVVAASHEAVWVMVAVSMLGSFFGYVLFYILGYWLSFRADYRESGRGMLYDIFRLQLVEQLPNVGTVAVAGVTQGALIGAADVPPVLAVNIGSWFGPHKIVNFAAMLLSNSLKKAWVDGTWRPVAAVQRAAHAVVHSVARLNGKVPLPGRNNRSRP